MSLAGCTPKSERALIATGQDNNQNQNINTITEQQSQYPKTIIEKPSNEQQTSTQIKKTNVDGTSLADLFKKSKSAIFLVYTSDGSSGKQGSGFFVSNSGIAVSNYHVFKGTTLGYAIIETADGSKYKIDRVLDESSENDYNIFNSYY